MKIKVPHFTTVIRWTLRTGLFLLQSQRFPLNIDWICILDHTIKVGTKKALVVLMVPLNAMSESKNKALTLKSLNVIHLDIREKWNGSVVEEVLRKLFFEIGFPKQIIRDGGSDLKKGINNIIETLTESVPKVTYDITHFIACLLKEIYSGDSIFLEIKKKISHARKKILQTPICFLLPPKERSKARFLNLPEYSKWFEEIFLYLQSRKVDKIDQKKGIEYFGWILDYKEWIFDFCVEINALSELQKLIKNRGISIEITDNLSRVLNQIGNYHLKYKLIDYIQEELDYSNSLNMPTLATSDALESLFGKYKEAINSNGMSEINRSILVTPCLTNEINKEVVKKAFSKIKNNDVDEWSNEHIGETQLSKRYKNITKLKNSDTSKCGNGQETVKSASAGGINILSDEDILLTG